MMVVNTLSRRVLAALASLAVLASCASLPQSGPVQEGIDDPPAQAPVDFVAQDPRPGDSPLEIVRGFLDGVTAGLGDEFAVARKYLLPAQAAVWNPSSAVMIYPTSATPRFDENDAGQIVMTVPISGTIDATGVYAETDGQQVAELSFDVSRDSQGQWRISGLDDGMIISEVAFNSQFRPFNLYFYSADRSYLVPDRRYFSFRSPAGHALRELSQGPAEWLAPGVVSAIPTGVTLAVLRVAEGVAHVEASAEILNANATDRHLILAQIGQTLKQLAQVQAVEITVAGTPLPLSGAAPDVQREVQFAAQLMGRHVLPQPLPPAPGATEEPTDDDPADGSDGTGSTNTGPTDTGPTESGPDSEGSQTPDPTDLPAIPDGAQVPVLDQVAILSMGQVTDTGLAVPDSVTELVASFDGSQVWGIESGTELVLLGGQSPVSLYDGGQRLLAPATDLAGWVWTGPRGGSGALVAVSATGAVVEVPLPELGEQTVVDIALSREGSRIALILDTAERRHVAVASVIRNAQNMPTGIGPLQKLAPTLTNSQVVSWLDSGTLAVLGQPAEATSVHMITLGSRTSARQSLPFATDVAGRDVTDFYIVTAQDDLYARSDIGWQVAGSQISELIFPG